MDAYGIPTAEVVELKCDTLFPTIVICGSHKFGNEFYCTIAHDLTMKGWAVWGLYFGDKDAVYDNMQMHMLWEIHCQKIRHADAIFVVNKDGYIGEGTAKEIEYAKKFGLTIYYLEPPKES